MVSLVSLEFLKILFCRLAIESLLVATMPIENCTAPQNIANMQKTRVVTTCLFTRMVCLFFYILFSKQYFGMTYCTGATRRARMHISCPCIACVDKRQRSTPASGGIATRNVPD